MVKKQTNDSKNKRTGKHIPLCGGACTSACECDHTPFPRRPESKQDLMVLSLGRDIGVYHRETRAF